MRDFGFFGLLKSIAQLSLAIGMRKEARILRLWQWNLILVITAVTYFNADCADFLSQHNYAS